MILNLISLFSGFLFSSIIDTSLGEFNEWAIVGAALIVSTLENISKFFYSLQSRIQLQKLNKRYSVINLLDKVQFFKIGIIYGLIVDAFKLGS